ncbi:helix-turn-helix domain-containing protein [Piscinibacter sakaiensis]|uniref:TetR/AcrR family transcriptional regulator n=1 Tax=Piscinibacter sakaiensis TaxID=1547922 RepID=UPI0006B6575B|nr:TetR/AcrR family transcriptional regulator [Piscinibacter sakaiensis]
MVRGSFREQVLQAREAAIVTSVNRLLAEKGYDAMTVDAVAADVGIAKASLYKHFASKEALAAAAMAAVLDRALARIGELEARADGPPPVPALEQLKAMARWAMQAQLAGEMPTLPAENSSLRQALVADRGYRDRLLEVSERLGAWIEQAQADGALNPRLPGELVLYTLFARGCDPVLGLLRASGQYDDDTIVELLVSSCFDGLAAGP